MRDRQGENWGQRSIGGDGDGNGALVASAVGALPAAGGAAGLVAADPNRGQKDDEGPPPWWVVHLAVEATDVDTALTLADTLAKMTHDHPMVVGEATTVSRWDDQRMQLAVYCCNRIAGSDTRCGLRNHHHGNCDPQARPTE